MSEGILLAIFGLLVPAACWLAYQHPSEYRRIVPVVAGALFSAYSLWIAYSFGADMMLEKVGEEIRDKKPTNWMAASNLLRGIWTIKDEHPLFVLSPIILLIMIGIFLEWVAGIKKRDKGDS